MEDNGCSMNLDDIDSDGDEQLRRLKNIDFNLTLRWRDIIMKYVCVKTNDGKIHEGYLRTIDPLSGNLVLLNIYEKEVEVKILMSEYIIFVADLKEPDETTRAILEQYFKPAEIEPKEETNSESEEARKDDDEEEPAAASSVSSSSFDSDVDTEIPDIKLFSEEALEKRRTELVQWLKKSHLPVKEIGNVVEINEQATVGPPYYPRNCNSENKMVRNSIAKLISLCPH